MAEVLHQDFSDCALVLLGHGSTKNAESAAPVYQHALALRRRAVFAEVVEAFWKQEPQVKPVLATLAARFVVIVPLFISEGYFSEQTIPQELGFMVTTEPFPRVQPRRDGAAAYAHVIGTHPAMADVLLGRAREVVGQFPFPRVPKPADTTLFIAGHGTAQNENSRRAIEAQAEFIRRRNEYAAVHAVFMEEEPRIAKCYALAETRNVVVVPFFMSDGMHTQEDIPVLLGEPERIVRQRLQERQPPWRNPTERSGRLVWYAPAVGTATEISDVIMERVTEAVNWMKK